MDLIDLLRGVLGMAILIALAVLFSNNRKNIHWRLVGTGILIQCTLGVFILRGQQMAQFFSPLGWPGELFRMVSSFFVVLLDFTTTGAQIVFGDLALSPGMDGSMGYFFAFQVLPTIIFFASITSILYHYGVLQVVVQGMATGMRKLLGTSGAETLSVTANIFVGQTESPLLIKPYIEKMTRSELLTVMTGGMATIAGGVMAAYIQMLGDAYAVANDVSLAVGRQLFAEQLLGASIMAAPAAIVISKILYPETAKPATMGKADIVVEHPNVNGIDAASSGAAEGLRLALNVGAMLLAFFALLAMINALFSWFGDTVGIHALLPDFELTMQSLLGVVFAPLMYLLGVPWADAMTAGSLLGTKVILTEFIAYSELSSLVADETLQLKTIAMTTFALCGFANVASIAVQIGGIGGLAPSRKSDLATFGMKAVLAGTMANLMSAVIAGVLY